MTKPVVSSFNVMAPLFIQKYERYLPTAFDESFSLVEKVNKIIQYLNEMGLLLNEVVEQWNEVMDWVMNEGLTQAVSDKLDEMISGGQLDAIVNINDRAINIKYPLPPLIGAKGDGVTDDTEAIQSIFDYAHLNKTSIFIPKSDFIVKDTLNAYSLHIEGVGNESRLIFENLQGKDGIVFNPSNKDDSAGVFKSSILCKGSNGGSAIKTPLNSNLYYTNRVAYEFEYLLFSGYTEKAVPNGWQRAESWNACFDIGDAWNVGIRECDGYGNFDVSQGSESQLKSVFIKLGANAGMLTAHISDFTCANFYRGVEIGERVFFQISNFDIVHSFDGVYQTAETTPFNESKLTKGNINAQRYGVYFKNVGAREIDGVIVRRHRTGFKGALHNFYGFYLENCSGVWLNNLHVQPDENDGLFPMESRGIALIGTSFASIFGFLAGSTLNEGIRLDNCTGVTTDNIMTWQNKENSYLFRLINNTRNSSLGKYTVVSTWKSSSKVYSIDNSVGASIYFVQKDMVLDSNIPFQRMIENDAPIDQKVWKTIVNNGGMNRQTLNDDETTSVNYELVKRSGNQVTEIEWRASERFFLSSKYVTMQGLNLSPVSGNNVPNNSFFVDSTTFELKFKNNSGVTRVI